MFDSMNLRQAISDIYDFGLDDDQMSLVHQANKELFMDVNTPGGISERQVIENTVLQGDTWGSKLASVWTVNNVENKNTGDTDLVEKYARQVEIGSCTEQRYLGFIYLAHLMTWPIFVL